MQGRQIFVVARSFWAVGLSMKRLQLGFVTGFGQPLR